MTELETVSLVPDTDSHTIERTHDRPPPKPDPELTTCYKKTIRPKQDKAPTKRRVHLDNIDTNPKPKNRKRSHLQTEIGKQLDGQLLGKKRKIINEVKKFIPSPQEAPANNYGKWNVSPQLIPTHKTIQSTSRLTNTHPTLYPLLFNPKNYRRISYQGSKTF